MKEFVSMIIGVFVIAAALTVVFALPILMIGMVVCSIIAVGVTAGAWGAAFFCLQGTAIIVGIIGVILGVYNIPTKESK